MALLEVVPGIDDLDDLHRCVAAERSGDPCGASVCAVRVVAVACACVEEQLSLGRPRSQSRRHGCRVRRYQNKPVVSIPGVFRQRRGDPQDVFGLVSLIFWALMIVVTIKYLLVVMRADNHG